MKKNNVMLLIGIATIVVITVFAVSLARVNNAKAQIADLKYDLQWAAVSDDLVSVEYMLYVDPYADLQDDPIIKNGSYFSLECPVTSIKLFDTSGASFEGESLTRCQRLSETQFMVSHFIKDDFRVREPQRLLIGLESQAIYPSGFESPIMSKDYGYLELQPEFEAHATLRFTSNERRQEGELGINSIELLYAPEESILTACVKLPDSSDWFPSLTFDIGKNTYETGRWELLDYKNPEIYGGRDRCYRFSVEGLGPEVENQSESGFYVTFHGVDLNMPECFSAEQWADLTSAIDFSDLGLTADSTGFVCPMSAFARNHEVDPRQAMLYEWAMENLPKVKGDNLIVSIN